MFFNKHQEESDVLEVEIEQVLMTLASTQPYESEYKTIVDNLETLMKVKKIRDEITKPSRIDPSVLAIAGNLAGILLILNYERLGVVSTKAFGLLMKARV